MHQLVDNLLVFQLWSARATPQQHQQQQQQQLQHLLHGTVSQLAMCVRLLTASTRISERFVCTDRSVYIPAFEHIVSHGLCPSCRLAGHYAPTPYGGADTSKDEALPGPPPQPTAQQPWLPQSAPASHPSGPYAAHPAAGPHPGYGAEYYYQGAGGYPAPYLQLPTLLKPSPAEDDRCNFASSCFADSHAHKMTLDGSACLFCGLCLACCAMMCDALN